MQREPIFNWPVVAALLVAAGLVWLVSFGVRSILETAEAAWGVPGIFAAFLAIAAVSLTYAYCVDRRADNLPHWLPRWLQRPERR